MAAIDDDDRPKKKIAHEIGQDLSLLSVEELAARVQLMHDEISRLGSRHGGKSAPSAPPPTSFSSANFAAPVSACRQKSGIGGDFLTCR